MSLSVFVYGITLMVLVLAKGSHSQLNVCGRLSNNTRIVGGSDASIENWPWQASIHNNFGHFCGGSLINEQWVLSAAHCFPRQSPINITIYLGRQRQMGNNPQEVSRTVTSVTCHPDFGPTLDNDICLLRLSAPVTFTSSIRPVCLAVGGTSIHNGTATWVTGWGTIQSNVPLQAPQTLQQVEMPVIGNRQCKCLLRRYGFNITENMICAGLLAGGRDSCQGDSGGPMVAMHQGLWTQVGVVSFGKGCALPNAPGVYASVSQYQTWISNQISSSPPGFVVIDSNGTDDDLNFVCPTEDPTTTLYPDPSATTDDGDSIFSGSVNIVYSSYLTGFFSLLVTFSLCAVVGDAKGL